MLTSTSAQAASAHYISLQDAVRRGHGAYSTLRGWIADGRLPAVKIGGRVKLTVADLEALAKPTRSAERQHRLDEQALEAAIDAVVERAPKLSAAQAARLATILGVAS